MLLTKPLTTFLHSNLSPNIHTLFIATSTGNLLASSSSLPASVLRSHATLASTLWLHYRPLAAMGTIGSALPSQPGFNDRYASESESEEAQHQNVPDPDISSILIQLENGTMLIRTLKSSLLFVAIGPSATPSSQSGQAHSSLLASTNALSTHALGQDLPHLSVATQSAPGSSHGESLLNGHNGERSPGFRESRSVDVVLSSGASYAGSTSTAGGGGASLRRMKKRVEDLAAWLDGALSDFQLGDAV